MSDDPPRPSVLISNRQPDGVDTDALAQLAEQTLTGEGALGVELSVSLVEPDEMARLHERYLGEPGPTDVLSFPQEERPPPDGEPTLLGDVVICPEVAASQNPDRAAELRLLLVHGILHLLGYEHETEDDRAEMWERQERYSGVRAEVRP
ncbi:MAG: rRNA maturation RNase YbeY [Actinomycetota bacterium]